ncbi:AF10 protein, partial [Erythrocercus mccallii]|nr:AF10 protein [Erythrocercus mccallii]
MEPIVLQYVPHDRFNKTCYICEEQGRESKAASGACMACNRHGCRQAFHVTCAQMAGLLCEEEVLEVDNVKYCGYCKYHFNKMGSTPATRTRSRWARRCGRCAAPRCPRRCSRTRAAPRCRSSAARPSPAPSPPPPPPPPAPPRRIPSLSPQGPGGHHEATKEGSEGPRAEAKGRKSSGHGSSHKGKKTGSGKSSGGFGSAAPGGTFQAAGSSCSLPGSQELLPFPKLEQEDEKFRKAAGAGSSSHCSPLYEAAKADVFEQKVIFSGFGSIMRFSTSAVGAQRARDASPVDYKATGGPSGGPAGVPPGGPHKRTGGAEEGEVLKEKKHKGSKKNKHGPGRPKAGRGKEALPGAPPAASASTCTSSSPFSAGSLVSSGVGSSSRGFGHAASLPGLGMESPLLGSGQCPPPCGDPGIQRGWNSLGIPSQPLPSLTGRNSFPKIPSIPAPKPIPCVPNPSPALLETAPRSDPGKFWPHPGMWIIPAWNCAPRQSQDIAEGMRELGEPQLDPGGSFGIFPRRTWRGGSVSREGSPISSLPTLFDQTVSCSSSGQLDNVPQATPNIEQLLEKQGNGEAGVNIVEMLKALHSLQKENQRLQEQIMTLTAKKERLQLLNVQLSVPFPVVTSSNGPGSQAQYILPASVCAGDSLSISKSPPCKNSFGIENSLSTSSEDPHSGCPSRSSSSLSFHSTPPPLPMLQPSPASLPLPGAQQVNGLARVAGAGLAGASGAGHSLSSVPVVDNLLGSLAGAPQLPLNGILGSLSGAQPPAAAPPALQLSSSLS